MKDGRGEYMKSMANKNLEKVRVWIQRYPGTTITECCKGVGMSYRTVRKHIDTIKKGEKE